MKKLTVLLLIILTGCASNVSGSWDCPSLKGERCMDLTAADKKAVTKLNKSESLQIFIAAFIDEHGNVHEAKFVPLQEVKDVK
jgi:hypothetical protein